MVLAAAAPRPFRGGRAGRTSVRRHALALRAEGAGATGTAAAVLALMPGSGRVGDELLPPPLGSVLRERHRPARPAALRPRRLPFTSTPIGRGGDCPVGETGGGLSGRVGSCAAGRAAGRAGAAASLLPEWMGAGDGGGGCPCPGRRGSPRRLSAARIRRTSPRLGATAPPSPPPPPTCARCCQRLVWNAASRAQWTEEDGGLAASRACGGRGGPRHERRRRPLGRGAGDRCGDRAGARGAAPGLRVAAGPRPGPSRRRARAPAHRLAARGRRRLRLRAVPAGRGSVRAPPLHACCRSPGDGSPVAGPSSSGGRFNDPPAGRRPCLSQRNRCGTCRGGARGGDAPARRSGRGRGGWAGGWGSRGAARSLKRNLGEAVDLLDDTLGAAIQGDFEEVERLSGELREVPGRIITDAFPVLGIGTGGAREGGSGGGSAECRPPPAREIRGRRSDRCPHGAGDREVRDRGRGARPEEAASGRHPLRPLRRQAPGAAGLGRGPRPRPLGARSPRRTRRTATGKPDPWGQDPEDEETAAGDVDRPGEDGQAEREGGDETIDRLQGEYAAALDRYLSAEEGSSDYESTLSALLEREKELLAGVAGQEEQELTPDERRRVQACLAETGVQSRDAGRRLRPPHAHRNPGLAGVARPQGERPSRPIVSPDAAGGVRSRGGRGRDGDHDGVGGTYLRTKVRRYF